MSRVVSLNVIFVITLACCMAGCSTIEGKEEALPEQNLQPSALDWITQQQRKYSEHVTDSARWLDQWIADDYFLEEFTNDSYLSLGPVVEIGEHKNEGATLKVRGRLDMPSSSKRLKLFFSSEDGDVQSIERRRGPEQGSGDQFGNSILGIELRQNALKGFVPDISTGVRLRKDLDAFVKYKLKKISYWGLKWESVWEQSAYYYHQSGLGYRTDLDFFRAIDEDEFLQLASSFKYIERYAFWGNYHSVSWHHRHSECSNVRYELGAASSYDKRQQRRENNYFVRVEWRRKLYEDWLFLYLTPELSFPRDFDYEPTPGLYLELSALFAKNPKKEAQRRVRPMPLIGQLPRE